MRTGYTLEQLLKNHKFNGVACSYCAKTMVVNTTKPNLEDGLYYQHWTLFPTKDHVIPTSRSGRLGVKPYILPCCCLCNKQKGNKYLEDWFAELEQKNDRRVEVIWQLMQSVEHKKAINDYLYQTHQRSITKKRFLSEKTYNYNNLQGDLLRRRHGKGKWK